MPISTTLINPAALGLDGAYVSEQIESQLLPAGPNSGLVCIPGAMNWGPIGQIRYCSDYKSFVAIGGDTQVTATPGSPAVDYGVAARVALAAAAGAASFAVTRVDDTTSVAATGTIVDTTSPTPKVFVTLTGMWHGTFGNRIKFLLALQSGTLTNGGNPVFRLTIFPPVGNPEVFSNIAAGATFTPITFINNLVAAVNGKVAGVPPSNWVTATAGNPLSPLNPALNAAPTALANGTDGTSGLTDSSIVGTDGPGGTRSGMYMFRGVCAGSTVILPGVTTPGTFQSLDAFVQSETAMGVWANFALGTSIAAAVASKATNSLSSPWVMLARSWVEFTDPATGVARWLEPNATIAGVIAGTQPWRYVGNKPLTGIPGIIATEDTLAGIPISVADGDEMEVNGINWIGNPINAGAVFGLYHGMMSDGQTYSSDVRMANIIALNIQAILARFVGRMQGTSPNDATRAAARAKVNEYMGTLSGKINGYQDVLDNTNNTPQSIAQGLMLCNLLVQTLTPVRFAVAAVQVGAGVQLVVEQQSN
jgi:uncharacterized protein